MKIFKLTMAILISAVIIFLTAFLFSSCNNKSNPENSQPDSSGANQTDVAEETKNLNDWRNYLDKEDYGGYEFRILTRDSADHIAEIYSESENGEAVNDAVFRRNSNIEDAFNIKIVPVLGSETDSAGITNMVKNSVLSGGNDYDFVVNHMVWAGNGAAKGYYYNWAEVPYVQMDKPWWSKNAYDNVSIKGKSYLAAGDISYAGIGFTMILTFNKDILSRFGLEDPYVLVKNGGWTMQKFGEMVRSVTQDVNGDQVYDANDLFGLFMAGGGPKLAFQFGAGQHITKKDENGYPVLDMIGEAAVSVFDFYYDLYHTGTYTLYYQDNHPNEANSFEVFSGGHSLFYCIQMNTLISLRTMEGNFGVLPYPKYDASQEKYNSIVNGHGPLMFIPNSAPDINRTGKILEAMAIESHNLVIPAYVDLTMKTKMARDEESAEMINYIMDGTVYDFGYVYDETGISYLIPSLMDAKNKAFVSEYEKMAGPTEKFYQKVIKQYESIAG